MRLLRFRRRAPLTGEALRADQAMSLLVAAHPAEFLELGSIELALLQRGGSIWPWRYRRQFSAALDRAELQLVAAHPVEWEQILDYLEARDGIAALEPEDFLP